MTKGNDDSIAKPGIVVSAISVVRSREMEQFMGDVDHCGWFENRRAILVQGIVQINGV